MRVRVSPSAPSNIHLNIENYNFDLPEQLIAKAPIDERSSSRLLVVDDQLNDLNFSDILDYLHEGDLLVINDTKVFKARLDALKTTGGKVEILLERQVDQHNALAMTKSNRPLKRKDRLIIQNSEITAEVIEKRDYLCLLKFSHNLNEVIDNYGSIPIPPYMNRNPNQSDYERYQTVYADNSKERSSASPTAGLHFEQKLLERIKEKGVDIAPITLDIGLGTFKPITSEEITQHKMHSERIYLSEETSEKINKTLSSKSKIISVGTTCLRCLESIYKEFDGIKPYEGETDIFIYPGFEFNIVNSLITNFHLPKTTLLLLVSAFAGEDTIRNAYQHAIKNKYRFYSYGDAMLINRK